MDTIHLILVIIFLFLLVLVLVIGLCSLPNPIFDVVCRSLPNIANRFPDMGNLAGSLKGVST